MVKPFERGRPANAAQLWHALGVGPDDDVERHASAVRQPPLLDVVHEVVEDAPRLGTKQRLARLGVFHVGPQRNNFDDAGGEALREWNPAPTFFAEQLAVLLAHQLVDLRLGLLGGLAVVNHDGDEPG